MLQISFSETPSEERWILHGRLTAPWNRELRACWKKNHRRDKQRACIVDMNEITFVDKSGERLLRLLLREGAQCIAAGDYTKHVLEQLAAKGKGSVLNRLVGFVFAAVVAVFAVQIGAQCIVSGVYIKNVFEQFAAKSKSSVLDRLTGFFLVAALAFAILIGGPSAKAQNVTVTGSVPSGPASDQVLSLALRDAIKRDMTQAEAELRQRKAEEENTRGQIDYDVRTAFLNLNAAREQVAVAKQNVELANESLARSKDRFTSGVTDSVEVVQAEQALASANDQFITSLYNHNFAKLSLARALGVARTSYGHYLGAK